MLDYVVYVFALIFGLLIGSFLNVVVLRTHKKKSFITGRSHCPNCKHTLSWYELIPVISWVGLGGRCHSCKKPISPQYPLVEAVTGLSFVLTVAVVGVGGWFQLVTLLIWLYVVASLIALAVYDFKWYLLPDKMLLPLIPAALVLNAIHALSIGSWWVFAGPLAAAALFGGGFYALAAVSKGKWMGGGDIKLAFVMGLLLGLKKTALAMLIGFNVAAVVAIILIAVGRKKRTDTMPFGPFLILGTLVAFWFGSGILDWYGQITGLNLL